MKLLFTLLFNLSFVYVTFAQVQQLQKAKLTSDVPNNREDQDRSYILDFVNPFIGTGGHGHTFPGASVPFGMMQLSPDTRYEGWDGCSGYHYSDSIIYGFSHTHLSGTGVPDYCDLLIVPQMGEAKLVPSYLDLEKGYGATFSHQNEIAKPGYYEVTFNNGIKTQLTVSERSGIHRYSFPENSKQRYILIDLTHRDKLLDYKIKSYKNTIVGSRISSAWAKKQHFYFYIETSIDPSVSKIIDDGKKLLLTFPESITKLELYVGISAVDETGAKNNVKTELGEKSFEVVQQEASKKWIKELSAVIVDTLDKDKTTNFYTGMYHAYLAPNIFSDVDRRYRGIDGKTHIMNDGNSQYTVFSLWDTYRSTHPWYTLFQTRRTQSFIRSFENMYLQSGDLPVWELAGNETNCMIGYHSVSVIADAYLKGIKKIDVPLLVHAVENTANINELGKLNFNRQGFIDYKEEPESVSKTLEYAYDSYCIYRFLEEAKKDGYKVKSETIEIFKNRAFNFVNVYNPQTGFMQARNGGIWYSPFKPSEVNFNFTEANSWQYSFYAPHAVPILMNLYGGKQQFETKLDSLFNVSSKLVGNHQVDITGLIGQYAHGNEPSHHIAYLYNYTDSPHKTALIVDSILNHYYFNAPDGLSGNEDCGQMSTWYTFSALGFYPVSPGNTLYNFGRPLFNNVVLKLENGHSIGIYTKNNSKENKFIQRILVNGSVYNKRYISHAKLKTINDIVFIMGNKPSPFYQYCEAPSSIEKTPDSFVAVPYFKNEKSVFEDGLKVEITTPYPELEIYYSKDNAKTVAEFKKYKKPIKIKKNTTIYAAAYNPVSQKYSQVIHNQFRKKDKGIHFQLVDSKYQAQYSASGKNSLIDGFFGGNDYRSGDWQGFYNMNVKGQVSFDDARMFEHIGLSALQGTRSWIFQPKKVEFIVTYEDGTKKAYEVKNPSEPYLDCPSKTINYEIVPLEKKVKSIEFTAYNYGSNPKWHRSPGYSTYIFLDEFYFK